MDVPATTRSSKRRSMDGAVPSTPPSSGKTKRREGQGGGYGGVSAGVLDFGVRDEKTKAPGETSPIVKRSSEDSMGDPQTLSTSSPSLSGESGEDDDMHTDGGVDAVAREAAEVRANQEDASIAFAKLLQEQERAFYEARSPNRVGQGNPCEAHQNQSETLGGSPTEVFRVEGVGARQNSGTDNSTDDAQQREPPTEEAESLALARMLMDEEQREWRSRMLALAGVNEDNDEGVDVDEMTYEELTELGETIGTQSKGLSMAGMAALIQKTYTPGPMGKQSGEGGDADMDADDASNEECAVCCCNFEDGDSLFVLPRCKHEYHAECLTPWVETNKVCPLCKTEIEEEKA